MTMYLSIIELNGTFVHRQNNNKRGKSLEEGRTTKDPLSHTHTPHTPHTGGGPCFYYVRVMSYFSVLLFIILYSASNDSTDTTQDGMLLSLLHRQHRHIITDRPMPPRTDIWTHHSPGQAHTSSKHTPAASTPASTPARHQRGRRRCGRGGGKGGTVSHRSIQVYHTIMYSRSINEEVSSRQNASGERGGWCNRVVALTTMIVCPRGGSDTCSRLLRRWTR